MSAQWLVYVLLVGTLLAFGANALEGALRQRSLPTRWIWLASLGGLPLFALFAPAASSTTIVMPMARVEKVAGSPQARRAPTLLERAATVRAMAIASLEASMATASDRIPASASTGLVALWLVASGALLSIIAITHRRAERAKAAWPIAELDGTPVRLTRAVGPAVIGLASPEIVLPSWILNCGREDRRIVIAHEREHVAARDQLLPFAGWLAAAALPWHPAVWFMLSRMRLAIELDCDARVLRRTDIRVRRYGALLVDIAGHCTTWRLGALALADAPSHLERRLLAMTHNPGRFGSLRTTTLALVAVGAFTVACEARIPTAADVEKMDAVSAEKTATQAMMTKEPATYFVNGTATSAEAAKRIEPGDIASVEITKNAQGAKILMTTKGHAEGEKVIAGKALTDSTRVNFLRERSSEPGERLGMKTREGMLMKSSTDAPPLFYIDGVVATAGDFARIDRSSIQSVDVIKGAAAAAMSTNPLAVNGIVKITTKQGMTKISGSVTVDGARQP